MATDEQGRELSPDGYYYWDGSNWQPVQQAADASGAGAGGPTAEDFRAAMNIEASNETSAVSE